MPSSHRELFPSVDEKKALEQLEKFQREIQSARWKREQASAEFESFVKGFGEATEPDQSSSPGETHPRQATPSLVRAIRRHSAAAPSRGPEQHSAATGPSPQPARPGPPSASVRPQPAAAIVPAAEPAAITTETPSYSMRLQRWRGTALVGAALVAIVLLAVGWWKNIPSETTGVSGAAAAAPPPARTQPPAQASAAPTTIPEPAAATAPVAQPAATLSATRRVWVRVMADGHRLFERELAAGESIRLDATQAIVIRAGDAGAVRITFADGRAETLGAEGQVVTKRFELKR